MLEKQYLGNNSPQFRLHLSCAVQREQFINRRQKMLLLLWGHGGLLGPQYMLFQWLRSQEPGSCKKVNSQWEGLLRERASSECHKGFGTGGGALLFVLQTFIVPMLSAGKERRFGGGRGSPGLCLLPLSAYTPGCASAPQATYITNISECTAFPAWMVLCYLGQSGFLLGKQFQVCPCWT